MQPHRYSLSHKGKHTVIQTRSLIVIINASDGKNISLQRDLIDYRNWKFSSSEIKGRKIEFGYKTDVIMSDENSFANDLFFKLMLGDDSEVDETYGNTCVASSAFLNVDLSRGSVEAFTSIVGLPPLFVYKSNDLVVITSALHLLSGIPQIQREVDIEAIFEMFQVGYPLYGRTLLKNVQMIPSGNVLKANVDGQFLISAGWNYPEVEPMESWDSFIELQVDAFRHAVRRLDVKNSFLSLSGGLDTRTVFAALIGRGEMIPSSTLSGKNMSLDARIARSLCEKYQIQHLIVSLDKEFIKNLPEYTIESSRLSGGLASLEQAHEVYFYRQLRQVGSRRISGNLGNQVGRGGVEGTSMRNADVTLLQIDTTKALSYENNHHWLESLSCRTDAPLFKLLLQHEVPYTFVSNYSIGQHFAVQQSPYANRLLIEATSRRPVDSMLPRGFKSSHARLKDLRHRFFGEDQATSFQQKVILTQGGYVAECPINWGWRVKGGVSLYGLGLGVLAFFDAYAGLSSPLSKCMSKGLHLINADGMHIFKEHQNWLLNHMYEFVIDTLNSKKVTESGIFNKHKIDILLTGYFSGKNHNTKDVIAVLDIALALEHFS